MQQNHLILENSEEDNLNPIQSLEVLSTFASSSQQSVSNSPSPTFSSQSTHNFTIQKKEESTNTSSSCEGEALDVLGKAEPHVSHSTTPEDNTSDLHQLKQEVISNILDNSLDEAGENNNINQTYHSSSFDTQTISEPSRSSTDFNDGRGNDSIGLSDQDLYGDVPNLYLTLGYLLESTTSLATSFNSLVSTSLASMSEISSHSIKELERIESQTRDIATETEFCTNSLQAFHSKCAQLDRNTTKLDAFFSQLSLVEKRIPHLERLVKKKVAESRLERGF